MAAPEPGEPPPTYDELAAENERLRERLGQVEPRIAELERLLEEVRRTAKRQSAPFSKNKPKEEWETPGRKKAIDLDPEMLVLLDSPVEPESRVDPMSPLRWSTRPWPPS